MNNSYIYTDSVSPCSEEYIFPFIEKFIENYKLTSKNPLTILDIGCGNGSILSNLQNKGFELYGIDGSESGIKIAKQSFPEINFFVGDITTNISDILPIKEFDLIICTEVIEHIYSPRDLVKNCYHFLKPGGKLIITTPYHGYLKNLILAITGKMDQHFTVLWDGGHIKFWSKKTLSKLLQESGFNKLQFKGLGRFIYLYKTMLFIASKPTNYYQ